MQIYLRRSSHEKYEDYRVGDWNRSGARCRWTRNRGRYGQRCSRRRPPCRPTSRRSPNGALVGVPVRGVRVLAHGVHRRRLRGATTMAAMAAMAAMTATRQAHRVSAGRWASSSYARRRRLKGVSRPRSACVRARVHYPEWLCAESSAMSGSVLPATSSSMRCAGWSTADTTRRASRCSTARAA